MDALRGLGITGTLEIYDLLYNDNSKTAVGDIWARLANPARPSAPIREQLDDVVPGEWDLTLEHWPHANVVRARLQILGVIREAIGYTQEIAFEAAAALFGVVRSEIVTRDVPPVTLAEALEELRPTPEQEAKIDVAAARIALPVSLDQVVAAMGQFLTRKPLPDLVKILGQFGVARANELTAEQRPAFLAAVQS